MKCSVYINTNFLDKHRDEFLYFVFNLSFLKAKFKNLAVFVNKHKPLDLALISYVLYTLLNESSLPVGSLPDKNKTILTFK